MRRSIVLALALGLGTFACGYGQTTPRTVTNVADAEWGNGPVEIKKVTALVRVTPPRALKAQMELVASRSRDPDFADFLRGHAGGGFGSGFLMVHRTGSAEAAFLVTNRHVVTGAEDAEVTFGDGTTYKGCEIVYVNPKADLAVLALPDSAVKTFGHGLRPTKAEPKERLTVIATGYPGVAGSPSFQMTEGKISNASFSKPELGMADTMIQHTAPIDPGSSGGPLTNEAGELVGANVALVRGRSAMFFAVPSGAIAESVRHAHELVGHRRSTAWMTQQLSAACGALAAELTSHAPDFERVDSFVSNQLVAREGFVSFAFAQSRPAFGGAMRQAFFAEPMSALRSSVLIRVLLRSQLGGGASGSCGVVNPSDAASIADGKPVRLALKTTNGEMELRWVFEQGAFRIVSGDLLDVQRILEAEAADDKEKDREREKAAPPKKARPAKAAGKASR